MSYRGTGLCFTELSEVSGTGIYVVPIPLPAPAQTSISVPEVPVSMSYRTYGMVRYRYGCRTDLTEESGAGINIVPSLPKCPVPVLMLYRTYRSVRYGYENLYRHRRYRYLFRTELTEVSGTGNTGGMYRLYASVRTVPNTLLHIYIYICLYTRLPFGGGYVTFS